MMSSSPPTNSSGGFNHYSSNQNQMVNLTSSPSYNDNLNLQLQNLNSTVMQSNHSNLNYTTRDDNVNDNVTNLSHSDNSLLYEHHPNQTTFDNTQHDTLVINYEQHQQTTQRQSDSVQEHSSYQREQSHTQQESEPETETDRNERSQHSQLQDQQRLQQEQHRHQNHHNHQHYQQQQHDVASMRDPIFTTPQYQFQEPINESEIDDFVPISSNLDPNLQFPTSSYLNLNHSETSTSSYNSNYFPQSVSGNSISSSLSQSTQQSHRLSSTALHNLTSTPSQTPNRKSNFVTPRVMGSNSFSYSHRKSKSKIALEKSPATANPFYNPPSFLSPKVSKKSHRKTISITNPVHLSHLDADLHLTQMHQVGRSGSPNVTPLRTPGNRVDVQYMYGTYHEDFEDEDFVDSNIQDKIGDITQEGEGEVDDDSNDNGDSDNNDDNDDHDEHDHHDDKNKNEGKNNGNNVGDDDKSHNLSLGGGNMMFKRSPVLESQRLGTGLVQPQPSANTTVNDSTFIMPNVLMKHKFGDKLIQTSNDLNNVLSDNIEIKEDDDDDAESIFNSISTGNYNNMNYLNGIFIPETSTVESLQQEIFPYPSSSKEISELYEPIESHDSHQRHKYNYARNSGDQEQEQPLQQESSQDYLQQTPVHRQQQQSQRTLQLDQIHHSTQHTPQQQYHHQSPGIRQFPPPYTTQQQYQHHQSTPHLQASSQYQQVSAESSPVVLKASSVPQTRTGSVSVESKIQRSGSSFNLSNIAASREGRVPNRYYRPVEYIEGTPPQPHSQVIQHAQQYDISPQHQHPHQPPPPPHLHHHQHPQLQHQQQQPYYGYEVSPHLNLDVVSSMEGTGSSLIPGVASLQEVAETRGIPRSSAYKKLLESPTVKTRSKTKRTTFALSDIKHPEKLDLPQQSARSRSRSKKSVNDDRKIHECPLCHMKFQRPEHVKRHMLSHSSEKPFVCPEPNCNKRFNRNDNLKQHLRNIHKKQI